MLIQPTDSGEEKKKLCKDLGADCWIDFKESKNIVEDVKKASGGHGAHSAVITAVSVSPTRPVFAHILILA